MAGPRPPRVPGDRPGRAGGKRDANRLERIRQLCDAATELFLEEGVVGVTIDQIVARAGVAKGSFYRYFRDKEELALTLFAPLAEQLTEALATCEAALGGAPGPAELSMAYLELARATGALIASHPRVVQLFLQESRGPAVGARRPIRRLADELADRAAHLSSVARDHGLLRELDPRVGSLIVLGAAERLVFEQLSRGDLGDPAAVSLQLVSVILDGVRPASR